MSGTTSANTALVYGQGVEAAADAAGASAAAGAVAGTGAKQTGGGDPQSMNAVQNMGAKNALAAQKAQAETVAEAMKQCADNIQSSCSGYQGSEKGKATDAEQQCRRGEQQARKTAAEKQAAQDQAKQNQDGSQANNDKGGGGSPPSPPTPPQGGDQGETPKNPTVDKPNVVEKEKPKQIEGTKLANNDMKEGMGIGNTTPDGSKASTTPDSTYASGISPASMASAENKGADSGKESNSYSAGGSASNGVSGGKGLGGSSSSGSSRSVASAPAAAANELAKKEEGGVDLFSSPSSSGPRPALGISTTGDELKDLLKPQSLPLDPNSPRHTKLAQAETGEAERNLFLRVKSKLNKISIDRHMQ